MKKNLSHCSVVSIAAVVYFVVDSKKVPDAQSHVVIENPESASLDGEYCFSYLKKENDLYDKREIKMSVRGTTVRAEKTGSSRSSEYSVGYTGSLEGTIDTQGVIDTISTIRISDGGDIRQEEKYQLRENQLAELTYRYTEDFQKDILRIDESPTDNGQGQTFPITVLYSEIECE